MNTGQKPIGWYLRELDTLITNQINNSLAKKGINRLQWQLLTNVAKSRHLVFEDFYQEIKHFADKAELEALTTQLGERGWLAFDGDRVTMTEKGSTEFQEIEAIQEANRAKIMQQIKERDYQTTIKVLSQMVANLSQ